MENINNTEIIKPTTMIIDEFRKELVDIINKSNLHISIIQMIIRETLTEVSQAVKTQAEYEKNEYHKLLAEQIETNSKKEPT